MSKYVTKQRKALLNFFSNHPDEQISAKETLENIGDDTISLSAIYRNLAALENDGLLKKFIKPGSRDVYYQFTGSEQCVGHLHLSCKKCGHTFHLNSESAGKLENDIRNSDGFTLDKSETVIYGICKDCNKNMETNKL